MENQKEFMLLFRFEPNENVQPTAADLEQQHQAWGNWIAALIAQKKFISTYRLGFEGILIDANQNASHSVHIADKQMLGGNLILLASNIHEAAELSKACPILMMGGNVEIRAIIPM